MKVDSDSLKWAINHLVTLSDSDLFPRPIELDVISELGEDAITFLSNLDLAQVTPGPSRRFIVPKDNLSYRTATQLDPLDSIFLAAIIYKYGGLLEQKRRPKDEERVFSYRFSPDNSGHFYDLDFSWNLFWKKCLKKSKDYPYTVILDISDFYNQIYHHTIENQLIECGLPNQVVKWIMKLLKSITVGVSRGIPIGPHSVHLLAEISLNPVDNSLISRGIEFCRYIDDLIIFCNSEAEARTIVLQVADILDKQQRLILQNQKTKILERDEFQGYCSEMIEDRPINDLEENIANIIKKYSGGNPYQTVYLSDISEEDLKQFNETSINKILSDYLSQEKPDYTGLRWFIRRLSQVGHPSGIKYCVDHFDKLTPAISEICLYFVSVSNFSDIEWPDVGDRLIRLLENEIIKSNGYLQMSIYSLFNRKIELNHLDKLLRNYKSVSPLLQREIIIAAYKNGASDWIRELKEQFSVMDIWTKRAFLIACSILPKEERKFFIKQISRDNKPLDELIIKYAKNQP